ncbi:GntR family transcriptional regulator, transcriptional repressor for pyruvate dehydrogenase complex [Burkholderia pseudomallei]|nr:GntR family transcriptional regulator, transcriptional repressor for pyruvate dehydrogenase complex [Burkholderia pseudomallei]
MHDVSACRVLYPRAPVRRGVRSDQVAHLGGQAAARPEAADRARARRAAERVAPVAARGARAARGGRLHRLGRARRLRRLGHHGARRVQPARRSAAAEPRGEPRRARAAPWPRDDLDRVRGRARDARRSREDQGGIRHARRPLAEARAGPTRRGRRELPPRDRRRDAQRRANSRDARHPRAAAGIDAQVAPAREPRGRDGARAARAAHRDLRGDRREGPGTRARGGGAAPALRARAVRAGGLTRRGARASRRPANATLGLSTRSPHVAGPSVEFAGDRQARRRSAHAGFRRRVRLARQPSAQAARARPVDEPEADRKTARAVRHDRAAPEPPAVLLHVGRPVEGHLARRRDPRQARARPDDPHLSPPVRRRRLSRLSGVSRRAVRHAFRRGPGRADQIDDREPRRRPHRQRHVSLESRVGRALHGRERRVARRSEGALSADHGRAAHLAGRRALGLFTLITGWRTRPFGRRLAAACPIAATKDARARAPRTFPRYGEHPRGPAACACPASDCAGGPPVGAKTAGRHAPHIGVSHIACLIRGTDFPVDFVLR